MLRIGMTGARRVHLHLGCIGCHPLRHSHVWASRGLLYHHRGSHSVLRIHELRCPWVGPHMRWLRGSLVHIELRHRLTKSKLCVRSHWGWIRNVAVLESGRGENLRRRGRHLHPVMVIEVRRRSVVLRMQVMRTVWWARSRRNTLTSLREVERKVMLVRRLRVRCRATLSNRRHSDRRLEHIGVRLLLVTRCDVPRRRGLIWWGDPAVESVILISLLRTLFLHPFDGVELVIKRWSLRSWQWLLCTEKRGRAGGTGY